MIRIDSIRQKRCQEMYLALCTHAANRTGCDFEGLSGRLRDARTCRVRSCVLIVMREQGYKYLEIAIASEREYTTIYNAFQSFLKNAQEYEGMWALVRELRDVAAELEDREIVHNV